MTGPQNVIATHAEDLLLSVAGPDGTIIYNQRVFLDEIGTVLSDLGLSVLAQVDTSASRIYVCRSVREQRGGRR